MAHVGRTEYKGHVLVYVVSLSGHEQKTTAMKMIDHYDQIHVLSDLIWKILFSTLSYLLILYNDLTIAFSASNKEH